MNRTVVNLGRGMLAVLLVAVSTSAAPGRLIAQPQADLAGPDDDSHRAARQAVEFWLGMYDQPAAGELLRRAGPPRQVARRLRSVASDSTIAPSVRLRAVDGLGYYSDEPTIDFLETAIDTPARLGGGHPRIAAIIRQHAIVSFARIRGGRAVKHLSRFIDPSGAGAKPRPRQTRLTAVDAVKRFGGRPGQIYLEHLSERPSHPAGRR